MQFLGSVLYLAKTHAAVASIVRGSSHASASGLGAWSAAAEMQLHLAWVDSCWTHKAANGLDS